MAIKTFLVQKEITAMIESANNLRDKVILTFLADCGCRVSELLAISFENIDLEHREVLIPHLKRGVKKHCPKCFHIAGRNTKFCAKCGENLRDILPTGIKEKTRIISIGEDTVKILKEFIIGAGEVSPDDKVISLSRVMVYKIVRNAAMAAGLAGKVLLNPETGKLHYVHPHDFRNALAVAWLDIAGDDATKQKALQTALGHKSFDTTMKYYRLTPTGVKNIGDEVRKARSRS